MIDQPLIRAVPQAMLVAETLMSDISGRYREEVSTASDIGVGLVLLVAVLLLVSGIVAVYLTRHSSIANTPEGLLLELCRAHGVSKSGARLIREIAASGGLRHPAMMFLGQANFDAAVANASAKFPLDDSRQRTLAMLRRRLFDS